MSFKPTKLSSLVLKKEKVLDEITDTTISTPSKHPIKSLGKFFNSCLKDTATIHKTCRDLEAWLSKVDNSGLNGAFRPGTTYCMMNCESYEKK